MVHAPAITLHLHLCISQTLLSKVTYITGMGSNLYIQEYNLYIQLYIQEYIIYIFNIYIIYLYSGYNYFFICICVPWELNTQPFALPTQCSKTELQKHYNMCTAPEPPLQAGQGMVKRTALDTVQSSHTCEINWTLGVNRAQARIRSLSVSTS